MCETGGMFEPTTEFEGFGRLARRLFWKTGYPERHCAMSSGANARVVPAVVVGVPVMASWIVERRASLGVGEGFRKESRYVRGCPARMVGLKHEIIVSKPPRDIDELVG